VLLDLFSAAALKFLPACDFRQAQGKLVELNGVGRGIGDGTIIGAAHTEEQQEQRRYVSHVLTA
jgi:hypothetical protein